MSQKKKILACVDKSSYANHVADYGAWAAQKLTLPLELLHVKTNLVFGYFSIIELIKRCAFGVILSASSNINNLCCE